MDGSKDNSDDVTAELHLAIPHSPCAANRGQFLSQKQFLLFCIGLAEAADPALVKVQTLLAVICAGTILLDHGADLGLLPSSLR
jgi:hypothetical protein